MKKKKKKTTTTNENLKNEIQSTETFTNQNFA
jgi:hypothetical protein